MTQHLSFVVLTYGGRLGINLGNGVPCLSCPYVPTCGGVCYLRFLQNPLGGLALPWPLVFTQRGLVALGVFISFLLLVAIFGQSWCGWLCPFGLLQDWISSLRRKLGIREAAFSKKATRALKFFKYFLLAYLLSAPILIVKRILPADLSPPFCSICPAKILMPLFAGDATWLSLDFTNDFLLVASVLLLVLTGLTLVGAFYKERMFCLICPMSALIGFFKFLAIFRLTKEPLACQGCGTCRRVCPVDLDASYQNRDRPRVQVSGCQGCFTCAESCAADGTLSVKFGPLTLFKSSRKRSVQ
ncbi:MAG: 4Fe-4S binding protein [Deltaproteobacteria bacterium]|nr:4Fe-4S binding protein [Deltaproteobacteria bacterium]